MANETFNGFIRNRSIEDHIVLFGGVVIDGFDIDGDAITSAKLRDAGEPTEGSGGYLCEGSDASATDVLTFRVLRGSNGFRRLRRASRTKQVGRLSIRGRNLINDDQDSYFSPCAYVRSSNDGPNIGQDKFAEFTVYAPNAELTDLRITA